MARVVLVVSDLGSQKGQAIAFIRQVSALSIRETLARVQSQEPVAELGVYGPDLDKRMQRFRDLVEQLSKAGASVVLYELLEGDRFSEVERSALVRVDVGMLENMVASLEDERRHREATEPIREDDEFH